MITRKTKSILGVNKPSFLSVNISERNCNRKEALLKTKKQQARVIEFLPKIKKVNLSRGRYGTYNMPVK